MDTVAVVPIIAEPSNQEYVPPPVPVRLIDGVEQVKILVAGGVIAALGRAMF
jgi:hypothetical protein